MMKKINSIPCQTYPESYEQLFSNKCRNIKRQLSTQLKEPLNKHVDIQKFSSPKQYFRGRIEFSIGTNPLAWLVYDEQKQPIEINHCPTVILPIYQRMPLFLEIVKNNPTLANRLFQVDWRATLQGECLISLLYHRQINETWDEQARSLAEALDAHIIGRSRKIQRVIGNSYIDDQYIVNHKNKQRKIILRQDDISFSQPNPYINVDMLNWVQTFIPENPGDLLELYCGIGNFTCSLAFRFRKILATELTRSAVALCKHNLSVNNINTVSVVRLSDLETAQALKGERLFNRLKGIEIAEYDFQWLLLDPPRNGLNSFCREFAKEFNNVIYFSCNPNEAIKDLEAWGDCFNIVSLAIFDQFPYTNHVEMGVVLKKR